MKKKHFFKTALFALFLATSQWANAQSKLDAVPLKPELKEAADKVISLFAEDPDKANNECMKLIRKNKEKDLVALGRYFYEQDQIPFARFIGQNVYSKSHDYLPCLSLLADTYVKTGELGKAGQMLDAIILAEPNELEPRLKSVEVYRKVNPEVAKEMLLEIKNLNPDYYQADRELGRIYYAENSVDKALEAYEEYLKKHPEGDEKSKEEYAILLFLTGQFDKSLKIVDEALKTSPNAISLTRMKFFDLYETGLFEQAKEAMEKHFSAHNDSLYNYSDYLYKGKLLSDLGDSQGALASLEKSISLNPNNLDTYADLVKAYRDAGDFEKAIATNKELLAKKGDKAKLNDFMAFGRLYYSAAQKATDEESRRKYIEEGTKIFEDVAQKSPNSGSAPLWMGHINALDESDSYQDKAKTYYEKAIELFPADEAYNGNRTICYNFLTVYAVGKEDYKAALECNKKALANDPEDESAKKFAAALKTLTK